MPKMIIATLLLFIPTIAFPDTHYVSKSGRDSGTCTLASQCLTINYGITQMSAGDTLTVGDGTYNEQIHNNIPNGSAGAYTIIKSTNNQGAVINGTGLGQHNFGIDLYSKSYVQIDGFKVVMDISGPEAGGIIVSGYCHHIKFFRCSVSGVSITEWNSGAINVAGPGPHDILFEECWSWGGGRYKFTAFSVDNVIFRRCVARHDYHPWNQCAGFVSYNSKNTQFQNCIILDSGENYPSETNGLLYGGYWFENNNLSDTPTVIRGGIVLNVQAHGGIFDPYNSGSKTISDTVIWGGNSGYHGNTQVGSPNILLNNMTIGNIWGTYAENQAKSSGTGVYYGSGSVTSLITKNSIIANNNSYGVADYMISNYNVVYGNRSNYGGSEHTPSQGANDCTTLNPRISSLLYLPRIETGSTLKTLGEGGGQIGAQIIYQHGTAGTLYGETGYDTLTTVPLWPFPNEALIKSQMGSYNNIGPSGARGFAAAGKQLNGVDNITLTSYIWEYLGNIMPSNIYTKRPNPPQILGIN